MSAPLFKRVAILGLGLIGASMALAARRAGVAERIAGYDIDPHARARARALELVDELTSEPGPAVAGADLVVLAAPVGACGSLAAEIAPHLAIGTIVTDVGSVKVAVIRDVRPHLPGHAFFVPGHPIAGTEQSGPDAGFAELFDGRWCILTPDISFAAEAVDKVRRFWEALGSSVEVMEAGHHDLVLAITSHVPHLIAYNIVGTADNLEQVTHSEVIKFSAAGFRDFTRIAASDPVMWRDVFLNNRDAVLEMLAQFSEDLSALQKAIRWGDGETLLELFARTRAIRRSIIEAGQETDQPDFGRMHGRPAEGGPGE